MSSQIKFGMKAFKGMFFDRAKIIASIDAETLRSLRTAGGYLRKVARNSIKAAPYGQIAPPGSPPLSHFGLQVRTTTRGKRKVSHAKGAVGVDGGIRNIQFALQNGSLIVGPLSHNASGSTPLLRALEEGGQSKNWKGETIQIAPHPFMRPALDKSLEQDRFAKLWHNSVKG